MSKKYDLPLILRVENLTLKLIKLSKELEEKNKLLESSELARKSMLSNITHDLRTPITVIRGAVERLRNSGVSDEERAKMVDIIDARSETLDHLVGDLYFSNLIEQPGFTLDLSCLDVAPILEEYYLSIERAGRLSGQVSNLSIPDNFNMRAMIDPQHFIRVLDNLLSNALRHTKPGDTIELGCHEAEGNVLVFIRDAGSGVHANDLPHIFDRTYTGEWARTPGKAGTGLGLSIAKNITEKHGGKIKCESIYGEGATFTISLPSA